MTEIVKNSIHTVQISGYSSEGMGITRIDGRVIFVTGAIAGEKCDIRILKVLKNIAYAKVERMLEKSPHRVEKYCPVSVKCGGCALGHMDYEEELRFKLERVQDAINRIGGLDLKVSDIRGSDNCVRYRNKAIFAVGSENGEPVTGFFRQRSHDVVPVASCFIQAEAADRICEAVKNWMKTYNVPSYDERNDTGLVRHVFCRYAFKSGQAQAVLVCRNGNIPAKEALISEIKKLCPDVVSIVININESRGNTVLAGKFQTIWGSDSIQDTLCGLKFSLSPMAFYQINSPQAENLYAQAIEYAGLTGKETVLDLYCGIGTITLCMARSAKRVIGAEIVEDAVENARENAKRNNIENAEFICADAGEAAKHLQRQGLLPDVVTVDPPRKGLSPDVIETIVKMSPERVVYVSCDPGTLARDLKIFDGYGYKAQKCRAFDMFPKTVHVESVCLLSRK